MDIPILLSLVKKVLFCEKWNIIHLDLIDFIRNLVLTKQKSQILWSLLKELRFDYRNFCIEKCSPKTQLRVISWSRQIIFGKSVVTLRLFYYYLDYKCGI